ncbi:hypothetical protein ALO40_200272 [Pseudomonas syringae pv. viburni]|uniref:Uncharacterized protein n=1 Tax=Pseudomonas syringae pv. viburni TaxID=251703 RepID=A0A0Q0D5H5_9PSED|nr:hypothetical protein ALO40_200272 [Pseudomonas syringae pv. viburni]
MRRLRSTVTKLYSVHGRLCSWWTGFSQFNSLMAAIQAMATGPIRKSSEPVSMATNTNSMITAMAMPLKNEEAKSG